MCITNIVQNKTSAGLQSSGVKKQFRKAAQKKRSMSMKGEILNNSDSKKKSESFHLITRSVISLPPTPLSQGISDSHFLQIYRMKTKVPRLWVMPNVLGAAPFFPIA